MDIIFLILVISISGFFIIKLLNFAKLTPTKKEIYSKIVKEILLNFILIAEIDLGNGTGLFKKSQVVTEFYNSDFFINLPTIIQDYINIDRVSIWIDNIVTEMLKPQIETNKNVKILLGGEVNE